MCPMEAVESQFVRPFDTVVNFNEDFHSVSQTSSRIDRDAVASEQPIPSLLISDRTSYKPGTRRKRTTLTIYQTQKPSNSRLRNQSKSASLPRRYFRSRSCSVERLGHRPVFFYQLRPNRIVQKIAKVPSTPPEKDDHDPGNVTNSRKFSRPAFNTGYSRRIFVVPGRMAVDECLFAVNEPSDIPLVKSYHSLTSLNSLETDHLHSGTLSSFPLINDLKSDAKKRLGNLVEAPRTEFVSSSPSTQSSHNFQEVFASDINQLSEHQQKSVHGAAELETFVKESKFTKRVENDMQVLSNKLIDSNSVKIDTVLSLKNKIAELYADVESLRCAHSQAIDHEADLQQMVACLKRSRDWYEKQLSLAQSVRNRMEAESERLQTLLKEGNAINHRLVHENACLQAQLACSMASLADAKRNLSHQLETIRVDMIEREVLFERIATERATLEERSFQRTDEVNTLQAEVCSLKTELKASDAQLSSQRSRLDELERALSIAETRRSELHEMHRAVENQLLHQEGRLKEQLDQYADAVTRIKALESDCEQKESLLLSVTEERDSVSSALSSACKEKDTLNFYLYNLKDNLSRIEDSLEKVRFELKSKNSQLVSISEQRDNLVDQLKRSQAHLTESCHLIDQLKLEKEAILATVQSATLHNVDHNLQRTKPHRDSTTEVWVQTSHYTEVDCAQTSADHSGVRGIYKVASTQLFVESCNVETQFPEHSNSLPIDFYPNTSNLAADPCKSVADFTGTIACGKPDLISQSVPLEQKNSPGWKISTNKSLHLWSDTVSKDTVVCDERGGNNFQQLLSSQSSLYRPVTNTQLHESPVNQNREDQVPLNESEPFDVSLYAQSPVVGLNYCVIGIPSNMVHLDLTSTSFSKCSSSMSLDASERQHNEHELNSYHSHLMNSSVDLTDHVRQSSQSHTHKNVVVQDMMTTSGHSVERKSNPHNVMTRLSDYFKHCEPFLDCPPDFNSSSETQLTSHLEPIRIPSHASTKIASQIPQDTTCTNTHTDDTTTPVMTNNHCAARTDAARNGTYVKDQPMFLCDTVIDYSAVTRASASVQCDNDYIDGLELEREVLYKDLRLANGRVDEAILDLAVARREAELHGAIAERETIARHAAVKDRQELMTELELTREKIGELQLEVEQLRYEKRFFQTNIYEYEDRHVTLPIAHANELEALRAIIKTTTAHLATMSESLNKAHSEKMIYQTELARLKGGIRAQLERFRLFRRLNGLDGAAKVAEALVAVGVDVHGLEDLLDEGADFSLLCSKPIAGLNKCFESLQTEITKLEDQVVHHAMAVHNSFGDCKSDETAM